MYKALSPPKVEPDLHFARFGERNFLDFYSGVFVPRLQRIGTGWDVRNGETSAFIGDGEVRMIENVDVALHPGMGIAHELENARFFDFLGRFERRVFERQREHENGFLLEVRVRDVQLGIVVLDPQPLAFLHGVYSRFVAATRVLDCVELLWVRRRRRGRGIEKHDDILQTAALVDRIGFIGQGLAAVVLIFAHNHGRQLWRSFRPSRLAMNRAGRRRRRRHR